MSKEIERAIEQLQHTISIFEDIEDDGNLEIDFIDVTAIKILMDYVKDSTPNSVIREKIEELKETLSHYDEYTRLNVLEKVNVDLLDRRIEILEEILEEGEK